MSAFRIIGDEIEYEFRPFARIVAPEHSTLRMYAEDEIWLLDPKKRDAEDTEWKNAVEAEHAAEIERLESTIEMLRSEVDKYLGVLNDIDGGATCAELIAEAQASEAKWREIAETNRAAYYTAIKTKPRKRRGISQA